MKTIVQRVCWNTRGWRQPAGSTDENGFPSKNGFGHEEWNFQIDDHIDDWIYGYMYSSPSIDAGETFRLYFYSIHPDTKDRLLVGCYRAAEIVEEREFKRVKARFKSRGILERRARELARAVPRMTMQDVYENIGEMWLQVRCPVSSVQIYDPPIRLSTKVGEKTLSHRFKMFTYVDERQFLSGIQLGPENLGSAPRVDLPEDGYVRECRENLKEIIRRHNKLSNALCQWLESRGIKAGQEKRDVDVEFHHGGRSYRVEIKVTYGSSIRHCLREAIGQLLEYNLYPGRHKFDSWIVLLDQQPDDEHIEYVGNLREHFKLPLHIGWRSGKAFQFCEPKPGDF